MNSFLPPALAKAQLKLTRTFGSVALFSQSRRTKVSENPALAFKPFIRSLFEYLWITWRNCDYSGYWNHNRDGYFRFDLDLKGSPPIKDFVFMGEFNALMKTLNKTPYNAWDLFDNKLATVALLERLGIPSTRVYAHVAREADGLYLFRNNRFERMDQHLSENDVRLMCKPVSSMGGQGIFMLESQAGALKINGIMASFLDFDHKMGEFSILEEHVHQHERMASLNGTSVNTLRMITARSSDGKIEYLGGLLRIGRAGSVVDNGSAGGLCVGLDGRGRCSAVSKFLKGGYQSCVAHPDTNVRFEGFSVPFFEEARELVLHAHRSLGPVHSLGWDVAITEMGPIIIEVNANWDTALPQMVLWPGRAIFKQYFATTGAVPPPDADAPEQTPQPVPKNAA